ncbi:MAG TPA: hypothetical protein VFN18_05905 [Solirubrobacterales bacterium]|nr:hypothetical protein [Solirubrobacterales bacterium]
MSDQGSTELEKAVPEKPRQAPFVVSLYRFHENIDALRQLHEEICGHAAEMDKQRMGPEALSAVQSLSPDRRERFQKWLEEAIGRERDEENPESGLSDADKTELGAIFGGNQAAAVQAWLRMQRALVLAPSRETLLRSSLLTMAVSAFEALVGNLAARHFELRPKTLGKEPKFSLEKLSEFDSVEEILDSAIAFRVFQLLQERLADWVKWFDSDSGLGIKLKNLAIDYQRLEELIQRRHIIVHNGGVVSSQYLERVHFDSAPPQLGEALPIDEPYLRDALEQLDAVGSLLGIGVWSKDHPEQEAEAVSVLSNRQEELLFEDRWLVLRKICSVAKHVASFDRQAQVFQVNEWLAVKNLEGLDAIRADIEASWDTTALEPQFGLVKHALLDQNDEFFRLAPTLLESGGIQQEQLRTWPVFADLRDDRRFAALLNGKS